MISSVIVRLSEFAEVPHLLSQLETCSQIEVGVLVGGRSLPLTLEAHGNHESEALYEWIRHLPGVDFIDIVFVYFDEMVGIGETDSF
jgi:nitrate reductase NapAB chaperone NapD